MSWVSEIFKGGTEGVFTGIGNMAKDLRTAITGEEPLTAAQRAELAVKLQTIEELAQNRAAEFDIAQMQGQVDLLKIDQSSPSMYKSGWRPAVGWVCVFGLSYTFLVQPILPWILAVSTSRELPPLPPLDMATLSTLLVGMLGLGTMRTFEKVRTK